MEAPMHGTFDKSRKSYNRIDRGSGIEFMALPALLVIAVIGLAMIHPAMPSWISEAVQAEFVNPDLVRDITPTQLAQPGQLAQPDMATRAVKAY
jgi:hypothetical protein